MGLFDSLIKKTKASATNAVVDQVIESLKDKIIDLVSKDDDLKGKDNAVISFIKKQVKKLLKSNQVDSILENASDYITKWIVDFKKKNKK